MPRKAAPKVQAQVSDSSSSESSDESVHYEASDADEVDVSDYESDDKKKSKNTKPSKLTKVDEKQSKTPVKKGAKVEEKKSTKKDEVVKKSSKSVTREKVVDTKKENVVESVPEKANNWANVSDDEVDVPHLATGGAGSEVREEKTGELSADEKDKSDHKGKGAKFTNSAINFDYSIYTNLTTPVSELNNKDLIKILIVRAHADGQRAFGGALKQTLQAMNLECEFPSSVNSKDQFGSFNKHLQRGGSQSVNPYSVPRGRGGRGGGGRGRFDTDSSRPSYGSSERTDHFDTYQPVKTSEQSDRQERVERSVTAGGGKYGGRGNSRPYRNDY